MNKEASEANRAPIRCNKCKGYFPPGHIAEMKATDEQVLWLCEDCCSELYDRQGSELKAAKINNGQYRIMSGPPGEIEALLNEFAQKEGVRIIYVKQTCALGVVPGPLGNPAAGSIVSLLIKYRAVKMTD